MKGTNLGVKLNPGFRPAKNGRTNMKNKSTGAARGGQSRTGSKSTKKKSSRGSQSRRPWWKPNPSGATNIFLSGSMGAGIAFVVNSVVGMVISEPTALLPRLGLKGVLAYGIHKFGNKLVSQQTADLGAVVLVALAAYDVYREFVPTFLPTFAVPAAVDPTQVTAGNGMQGLVNVPEASPWAGYNGLVDVPDDNPMMIT